MSLNIFLDNSNIWLVGRKVCSSNEPGHESAFRIHFAKLFDFVRNNRAVSFAYVGGSVPPNNDDLWLRLNAQGAIVEKQERAVSGGEVAVDEAIQLQMANRIIDVQPPETMVLLTGDGSGYTDGKGFIKQLERALKFGWKIEVISWDAGCNRHLKEFAQANGCYRPLEPAYANITFVNNVRWAK
ncbi:NYN domain-containing protein [Zoogloea sp. 1C4]|uniref:NYN domain-containing protein n=1 Tax=Zoogloea sp. 1C4 TaxID=2570190 RepID=UPI0018857955|nr:NYN domain-containing protein [Zoogloea sp. 1C4]